MKAAVLLLGLSGCAIGGLHLWNPFAAPAPILCGDPCLPDGGPSYCADSCGPGGAGSIYPPGTVLIADAGQYKYDEPITVTPNP